MELIKQIKQAEAQAQQVIEQAKTESTKQAEAGRELCQQSLAKAEQERKKAIEAAEAAAQSQGLAEIKVLKAQAKNERQQLREKTTNKIAAAVEKVMEHLGSHSVK